MLEAYSGCVLIVSHDRAFMENVVDAMLILDGTGAVTPFTGRYSAYLRRVEDALEAAAAEQERLRQQERAERAAVAAERAPVLAADSKVWPASSPVVLICFQRKDTITNHRLTQAVCCSVAWPSVLSITCRL